MNSFCKLAFLILATLLASAPAAARKTNTVQPGEVKSVAIVNEVEPGLNYSHRAMTIFGNENRVLDNDWNLPAAVGQSVVDELTRGGIAASEVKLSAAEMDPGLGKKCWSGWSGKYKPKCQPALDVLLDRLGADALVVIRPIEITDYYFSSPVLVKGLGVHTMGIGDEIKRSVVVAHIGYGIVSRKGLLTGQVCLSDYIDNERKFTATPKTLALSDVAYAEAELRQLVAENAGRTLRATGILPGGLEKCPHTWGKP